MGLAQEQILQSLLQTVAPFMWVGVGVSWPLAWQLLATDPLLGIQGGCLTTQFGVFYLSPQGFSWNFPYNFLRSH